MKLLALDTATEQMALAVAAPHREFTLHAAGGAAASAQLIDQLLALLNQAGLTLAELDAVAFGQGPGAFTGLRTAVSVAQGLAFGANKPVLAIDSLLIVAEDARQQALAAGADPDAPWPVWVAMDARMDEVYGAAYLYQPQQGWQTTVAPALYDLPSLAARWALAPPLALAGSALAAFGPRLPVPAGAGCWPDSINRASALLSLARAAWQAGAGLPAEQALPVYLRDKVALTTAEREAHKAAQAAPL